jgi:hypothetical protein
MVAAEIAAERDRPRRRSSERELPVDAGHSLTANLNPLGSDRDAQRSCAS